MSGYKKNAIVMGAEPGSMPPWTDAQRDAQIEALRAAYIALAETLQTVGALDMQQLLPALGNLGHAYKDKSPDTYDAVMWLADTIEYNRAKIGAPTRHAVTQEVRQPRD